MSDQETPQQIEIRVGFEAALDKYFPEWKTSYRPTEVDRLRHFYLAGVQDTTVFVNIGTSQMSRSIQEGVNWLGTNVNPESPAPAEPEPAQPVAAIPAEANTEPVAEEVIVPVEPVVCEVDSTEVQDVEETAVSDELVAPQTPATEAVLATPLAAE